MDEHSISEIPFDDDRVCPGCGHKGVYRVGPAIYECLACGIRFEDWTLNEANTNTTADQAEQNQSFDNVAQMLQVGGEYSDSALEVYENVLDDDCISISCLECGSLECFECQINSMGDFVDVEICCNGCGFRFWATFTSDEYLRLCI